MLHSAGYTKDRRLTKKTSFNTCFTSASACLLFCIGPTVSYWLLYSCLVDDLTLTSFSIFGLLISGWYFQTRNSIQPSTMERTERTPNAQLAVQRLKPKMLPKLLRPHFEVESLASRCLVVIHRSAEGVSRLSLPSPFFLFNSIVASYAKDAKNRSSQKRRIKKNHISIIYQPAFS